MSLFRQRMLVLVSVVAGFAAALAAVATGWATPAKYDRATAQVGSSSARLATDDRQIAEFKTEVRELAQLAELVAKRDVSAS